MRAMLLEHTGPVESAPLQMRTLADPLPGTGEILVRVSACGVCRTDLHTVEGELPSLITPVVPGHQIVGRVDAVGTGVDPALTGTRVGVAWMAGTCGRCPACRAGAENLCEEARFTGLHRDGGYAELATARADFAYPLPPSFPDDQAAPLLCAGVIGLRALRLAGALAGGTLGVFGFGASAHVAIQVARHRGARVLVFSRSERHRRHALELGAAWAGEPGERPPFRLDHAVIFSPAGEQAPLALSLLAPGGTVACAGVTMSDIPAFAYELLYRERRLVSVANATRADAGELLALAAEIPIKTAVEVLPLADANEALRRVKESRTTGALVLRP